MQAFEAKEIIKGVLTMANGEVIPFELYPECAPNTVKNFVSSIESKFYDGLTFHRVIPAFVSQGGCPRGDGTGELSYTIKCETAGNPLKHIRGAISMAHCGKDTGSCQFFICHEPQPHLDGRHTVFGQVTANMEAVTSMRNGSLIEKIEIVK